MSHIWVLCFIYMSESRCIIWVSHVTYTSESCRTYEWVVSHKWKTYTSSLIRVIRPHSYEDLYVLVKDLYVLTHTCYTSSLIRFFNDQSILSCLINERLIRPHSYVLYVLTHTNYTSSLIRVSNDKSILSCLINERLIRPSSVFLIVLYEWVMSHIWMSHGTSMGDSGRRSCHTYARVTSRTWVYSFCTYEWVMSHIWMSHVTRMNESCHTYEWVMSHIWMSHITHTNRACHTYEWVMSHLWISHITHTKDPCLPVLSWLYCMNSSYCKYQLYAQVTWLIDICMSHVTHINGSRHVYVWVLSHIWTSHVTYTNNSCRPWGGYD